MTHTVGTKGQVVIPKEMRDSTGLHPGTEVDFALDGDRVVVAPRRGKATLGGRFQGSGMSARLIADRAREPR
jgi:AbrB family looped-hinge helix DNA binding protein